MCQRRNNYARSVSLMRGKYLAANKSERDELKSLGYETDKQRQRRNTVLLTEQVLLHGVRPVQTDGTLLEDVLQELGPLRQTKCTHTHTNREGVSGMLSAAGRCNDPYIQPVSQSLQTGRTCQLLLPAATNTAWGDETRGRQGEGRGVCLCVGE